MFAQLPSWWTTMPPWVTLPILVSACERSTRASLYFLKHRVDGKVFFYQYGVTAVLCAFFIIAQGLRWIGVFDRLDYLDFVGPTSPLVYWCLWRTPAANALHYQKIKKVMK
jgi:hypothetical protein